MSTSDEPAQGYARNPIPRGGYGTELHVAYSTHAPWHQGLFGCFSNTDFFLESWCCLSCQVTRQWNMLSNGVPLIPWPCCLMLMVANCVTSGCVLPWFVMYVRSAVRKRYGIEGHCVGDCCTGWFCTCCAVAQMLYEMTVMGDYPGTTCSMSPPPSLAPLQPEIQ